MQLLSRAEAEGIFKYFDRCATVARQSICLRAHCGAVIVKDDKIISEGRNGPPLDNPAFRTCLREYDIPAGFRHDRTCCIHTEQRALDQANRSGQDLKGARIYFIRVDKDGNKLQADALVCTICSRAVLDAGISEFALYWTDGIRVYEAAEFNELSYEYRTPRLPDRLPG